MIADFIGQFTDMQLNHVQKFGREYYQIFPELDSAVALIRKNAGRDPVSAGVFLGEERRKVFVPSIALLDILGRSTDRWVVVDEKAEWLFLCGRDVFAKSVVNANVKDGIVLVASRKKEVLGYGAIAGDLSRPERVFIRNMLDKGDFLRREMSKSKSD